MCSRARRRAALLLRLRRASLTHVLSPCCHSSSTREAKLMIAPTRTAIECNRFSQAPFFAHLHLVQFRPTAPLGLAAALINACPCPAGISTRESDCKVKALELLPANCEDASALRTPGPWSPSSYSVLCEFAFHIWPLIARSIGSGLFETRDSLIN